MVTVCWVGISVRINVLYHGWSVVYGSLVAVLASDRHDLTVSNLIDSVRSAI